MVRTLQEVQLAVPLCYAFVEVDWLVQGPGEGRNGLDTSVVGGGVDFLGRVREREDVFC